MKRRGDFMEDNMENKRYRGPAGGEVECRLLIPSKMGGAVIGKKGSNIQKLRSEFSANIRISEDWVGNSERDSFFSQRLEGPQCPTPSCEPHQQHRRGGIHL